MSYSDLLEQEQALWDEYGTLRAISDWDGFTPAQNNRKLDARAWLVNQRKEIWRRANDEKNGWSLFNRAARYNQLKEESLNNAVHKHEYALPANGCTPTEKSYIEEREGYLMIGGTGKSMTTDQAKRKTANVDWLVNRRKQVYHLLKESPKNDRQLRYENLCIATSYGSYWKDYQKSHNKYGQEFDPTSTSTPRAQAVANARRYLGTSERPAGSNKGHKQPSNWQVRVIGSDGYAWCACFACCMALDAGCSGAVSAGVVVCMDMAQRGVGIFRGWTTDPSKVQRGDLAVIGCKTCHIGLVADSGNPYHTIEGNTSPGSEGSQYNGGCVAEKTRGKSEIIGWCLVDYPG